MIKGYYKEKSLPGFTAQNLFVYKHETSPSLRNRYSGLSALIKPASCYNDCVDQCYISECRGLSGPAKMFCVRGCKNECSKLCGTWGADSHSCSRKLRGSACP
jgi:hypothetical protein